MKNKKRIEFDSIGSKKIDKNKLWGAQTQRSVENFKDLEFVEEEKLFDPDEVYEGQENPTKL